MKYRELETDKLWEAINAFYEEMGFLNHDSVKTIEYVAEQIALDILENFEPPTPLAKVLLEAVVNAQDKASDFLEMWPYINMQGQESWHIPKALALHPFTTQQDGVLHLYRCNIMSSSAIVLAKSPVLAVLTFVANFLSEGSAAAGMMSIVSHCDGQEMDGIVPWFFYSPMSPLELEMKMETLSTLLEIVAPDKESGLPIAWEDIDDDTRETVYETSHMLTDNFNDLQLSEYAREWLSEHTEYIQSSS